MDWPTRTPAARASVLAAATAPVAAAEAIKDELQRRLGLDASLGLASTRLAARVASTWARPRGLLVVLPGYEALFLARQQLSFLPDLPSHIESALEKAGFETLGQVGDANAAALAEMVGQVAAERLQDAARGAGEQPIAVTAPPSSIQEEAVIQLADILVARVNPDGLAVVMEADHFCMHWRGVKDNASKMTNSVMRGVFLKDGALRREFLSLINLKDE